jgi:hypothetical protein
LIDIDETGYLQTIATPEADMIQISFLFRESKRPVLIADNVDHAGRFVLHRLLGLGLVGLAAAGAWFAVAGFAEAGTTGHAALVSPQYQAKTASAEPGRTVHTGESGSESVPGQASTRAPQLSTARRLSRYHVFSFQYQFRNEISLPNVTGTKQGGSVVVHPSLQQKWNRIVSQTTGRAISNPSWTGTETPVQNPPSGDERHLLQLGLAFALLYVVFLVVWFWGTREGRRRFEGATRS